MGLELYCKTLYNAMCHNLENLVGENGLYQGKAGCMRLAREYGHALVDFRDDPVRVKEEVSSSYSVLCVRVYQLRPPVDAKEWNREIWASYERGRSEKVASE